MLKKSLCLFVFNILCIYSFSQDVKNNEERPKTKMEEFFSRTGGIVKFIDYKLPNLKSSYATALTWVREVSSENVSLYFYQIEKKGQYSDVTASIEYGDLLELLKALDALKSEVERDKNADPDYLENKFITDDGFQLGYYISKGKATWFLKLERYGSDNTLYLSDVETISNSFQAAKLKIEELKK